MKVHELIALIQADGWFQACGIFIYQRSRGSGSRLASPPEPYCPAAKTGLFMWSWPTIGPRMSLSVITVYEPDPALWSDDFRRRKA
jgi:hypothetical protein